MSPGGSAPRRVRGSAADEKWMHEALTLAARGEGSTRPNPPVGAVVVKRKALAGAGFHKRAGTRHAEAAALDSVEGSCRGGTLYVTLEPCSTHGRTPPCTDRIIREGIRRVVVSVPDPNPIHRGRGLRLLRRAGIEVVTGICSEEGRLLIAPFAKWVATSRPYVTLKLAVTIDGRIADAGGKSKWITGSAARRCVQDLRRRVGAVLVGAGTACQDDPSLLYRRSASRPGLRVVVDSRGRLPLSAQVLNDRRAADTVVATTRRCPSSKRLGYEQKGAKVWVLPSSARGVSLPALMDRLGEAGILRVLCEGGGEMAASLFRGRLVDDCVFFLAPKVIGGSESVSAITGAGWQLRSAPRLRFTSCERVGEDLMVRALPV